MFDDVVMSDVKEEEVVNRITKMASNLHFSGDGSCHLLRLLSLVFRC